MDYNQKTGIIIDVAIPADINIVSKEKEKVMKYQQLRIQLEKLLNVKFTIVPVLIGALGSFTSSLLPYLKQLPGKQLPGKHLINPLTKAILLAHPVEGFRPP